MSRPRILAVVGATATGKSDLAVDLAQHLDGEVINADALQLYRGMDIGTAKITVPERRGIPHHLLDVLDVTEEASVSAYQREGRAAIAAIAAAGRLPVVVGGSGLYIRALLDEIAFPPTDPRVRAEIESEVSLLGPATAHLRLREIDPEAARVIGPQDERRIVRALEVNRLTGTSFRAFLPRPVYAEHSTLVLGLRRPRPELHERIALRAGRMMEQGLIEETRSLRDAGLESSATARRAIGYAQALAVLDGAMTPEAAEQDIVAGTRRLVRKQDTWFRRDPRVRWIEGAEETGQMREAALGILDGWIGDSASTAHPNPARRRSRRSIPETDSLGP